MSNRCIYPYHMKFDKNQRRVIYEKTDGHCHICHIKLSFVNYAREGERGAWEVEHSRPQAKGGTHHGNNLFPACIICNRNKSDYTTHTARGWNGTALDLEALARAFLVDAHGFGYIWHVKTPRLVRLYGLSRA